MRLWGATLLVALGWGCSAPNPAYRLEEGVGGSGTGIDDAADGTDEGTDAGDAGDDGQVDAGEDEGIVDEGGLPSDESGDEGPTIDVCDGLPIVDDSAYASCREDTCSSGTCFNGLISPPVVFDASVCVPECEQDCQCPKTSEGIGGVCNNGRCELPCLGTSDCPSGMACGSGHCVWPYAYGTPCDESCPSTKCVVFPPENNGVCTVLDCMTDGGLDVNLCPPGTTGNATTICFEPGNFPGEGWCALSCAEGETCPEDMFCNEGLCSHP